MMRRVKIFLLALLALSAAKAQDIHFSQFYDSPILLNPAAAGACRGDYRIAVNYRNQWKSVINPYKTAVVAFDTKLFNKSGQKNYLGLGASVFNDKTGISKLTTNQLNVDLAYHLGINESNRISIGAKTGFFQRYINYSGLKWDNQYNGVDYDASRSTGENLNNNRYSDLDIGAGLLYDWKNAEKGMDLQAGVSAMHLTTPRASFQTANVGTAMKIVGHAGMSIKPKEKNYMILPAAMFAMQSGHTEITGGGNIAFLNASSKLYSAIYFGSFYRVKDAVVFVAALEYKGKMKFGVSYDFNVSKFTPASKFRGGPEFSFVFNGFRKEKKKPAPVATYTGTVYGDGKPIPAEISILPMLDESDPAFTGTLASANDSAGAKANDRFKARNISSDAVTGNYFAELEAGMKFKIKISSPGFETYEEMVDLTELKKRSEEQMDFNLKAERPKTAVYTGSVQSMGKPVPAKIVYTPIDADPNSMAEKQEANSDPENGIYRSQLKTGKKYKVQVLADGYETFESEIDLLSLKDQGEQNLNFDLVPKKVPVADESPCSEQLPDISSIKGKSLRDPVVYAKMLDLFSNWCMEGVVFKVQVAAYPVSRASEYHHKYLDDLGHIGAVNYPDGLTRFTLDSEFKTIKDVEALRQKAIGHGQKDSWITVLVHGKRVTLEDFIGH